MGRFLYVILWTMLSATKGHYVSAIVGQNPSAQALSDGTYVVPSTPEMPVPVFVL